MLLCRLRFATWNFLCSDRTRGIGRRLEEAEGDFLAIEGFEAGAAGREDEPAQLAPFKYGQHRRRGHDTNERDRTRLTSTATPPLLTVSRQSRLPHISASRTREGAKMRGLDTDFA